MNKHIKKISIAVLIMSAPGLSGAWRFCDIVSSCDRSMTDQEKKIVMTASLIALGLPGYILWEKISNNKPLEQEKPENLKMKKQKYLDQLNAYLQAKQDFARRMQGRKNAATQAGQVKLKAESQKQFIQDSTANTDEKKLTLELQTLARHTKGIINFYDKNLVSCENIQSFMRINDQIQTSIKDLQKNKLIQAHIIPRAYLISASKEKVKIKELYQLIESHVWEIRNYIEPGLRDILAECNQDNVVQSSSDSESEESDTEDVFYDFPE